MSKVTDRPWMCVLHPRTDRQTGRPAGVVPHYHDDVTAPVYTLSAAAAAAFVPELSAELGDVLTHAPMQSVAAAATPKSLPISPATCFGSLISLLITISDRLDANLRSVTVC